MKTHTWGEKFTQGLRGESQLDKWLRQRDCLISQATREQQKKGIDRIVTRPDWTRVSVEYKTDYRARETGNAYIETVSVDNADTRVPGWVHTSQADIILYYVHPIDIYVLSPQRLRESLQRWRKLYRTVDVRNQTYSGQGVLVPLDELAMVADNIIKAN